MKIYSIDYIRERIRLSIYEMLQILFFYIFITNNLTRVCRFMLVTSVMRKSHASRVTQAAGFFYTLFSRRFNFMHFPLIFFCMRTALCE